MSGNSREAAQVIRVVDLRCSRCARYRPHIDPSPLMGRVLDGLTTVYSERRVGQPQSGYSQRIHGPDMKSTPPTPLPPPAHKGFRVSSHEEVLRKGGQLRCRECRWSPRDSHRDVVSEAKITAAAGKDTLYV